MDQYFGHKPQDWERSMMQGQFDGTGRGKEMQRAVANPEEYTTARPNMATEAAFTVGSMKGAGKDGLKKGPSTAYYKIEKPEKAAPEQQAPAPEPEAPAAEPEKDKGPLQYSPEVSEAKERVNNYQSMINGNEGSTFSTDASAPAEASSAGTNSISFEPAKIDTPSYNPDAGKEEEAQSFADKYKLGIINSGSVGQSDFSAV